MNLWAADAVLILHVLFVAYVVLGLVLILIGKLASWRWVHSPWFRLTHIAAIGVVVAQSWLGITCPLTTLEMALRARAGDTVYGGSFIEYWLSQLLYFSAPDCVFALVYSLFGLLIAVSWYWVRPRRF